MYVFIIIISVIVVEYLPELEKEYFFLYNFMRVLRQGWTNILSELICIYYNGGL